MKCSGGVDFRSDGACIPKQARGGAPGAGRPLAAALGPPAARAAPAPGVAPPRALPDPWLISSKNSFLIFREFSADFLFLHKNKTPNAILLKTASVRVSSNQILQIRAKTTAKVFGKVHTFATYQLPQA